MSADVHDLKTEKQFGKAGALLHSLVPRAQVFCFYDRDRDCTWSSDGAEDGELDAFVADLPTEIIDELAAERDILKRSLKSGRTVLLLPVYSGSECTGTLVALFSKNAGKSGSFNPSLLKSILEPALDVIGEALRVGQRESEVNDRVRQVEEELRFVYDIDEKIHGASGRHSSLAQLVGRSGRYLGINYSVLMIPSKRIRISATHASWKGVKRRVLDRYLVEHLMPKLEGHRLPRIFEIPAQEGTDSTANGYQALLCPVLDQQGNVEGVLAQLGRVNNEKFTRDDRRFMAHVGRKIEYVIEQSFDAMTGLMNRSGFEAQLEESYKTLSGGDTHQVIYFDLDNLQLVNDTFSRKAGDEVIMRFARLLEEGLPKTGVLSRLTGDDFCMLLTDTDVESALEYANNVRDKASSLRYLEGDRSLQVTMSVGITEFRQSNTEMGAVLTTARMACEAAKEHGRDRIEVFDEGNRSAIRRYDDMQLVATIQQALDNDEFQLMAQPIDCLTGDSAIPQYEVLLRMADGDGGKVPSTAFFSAAERYRLMPQIDRWVVSHTLATMSEFQDFVAGENALFSVNLSGQSLGDDDFLEFVEEEIEASGLPPETIGFEITESAAVSNLSKAQAFIDRLSELGCHISLDDFGAGLSSFAYLKNFKVDSLKIDGSFIRDITVNRISESMVAAITQVAKVMELTTVAEYVESKSTRKLITELGVDYAQGHIIGKPSLLRDVLSDHAETMSSTA